MSLSHELAKTAGILLLALARTCGYCPLPVASIVALLVIQCSQLLACIVEYMAASPSKASKVSFSGCGYVLEVLVASKSVVEAALVEHPAFRYFMWILVASFLRQVVYITGLSLCPLLVPIMACCVGAMSRYAIWRASASGGYSSDDGSLWPSVVVEDPGLHESPLADLAVELYSTALMLQLPALVTEDTADLVLSDECSSENADEIQTEVQDVLATLPQESSLNEQPASPGYTLAVATKLAHGGAARTAMWLVLAALLKQVANATGLCDFPLLVAVLACGIGGLCQCCVTALDRKCTEPQHGATSSHDPAFWPAVPVAATECESPLASLASELHSTRMMLQLPAIEIDED